MLLMMLLMLWSSIPKKKKTDHAQQKAFLLQQFWASFRFAYLGDAASCHGNYIFYIPGLHILVMLLVAIVTIYFYIPGLHILVMLPVSMVTIFFTFQVCVSW